MNVVVELWLVMHAACVQADRLPGVPVTDVELVDEIRSMQQAPTSHAEREAAYIALLKQGGASDADIRVLPLADAKVHDRVEKQKELARTRMEQAGATPAEIDAGLRLFDQRRAQFGNNIMIVLPGRTDRVIGFGAHLDAADGSAGILDDWAGCVLLANLYQTLRTTRPQHTLWFVAFAEEEQGCLGSAAWAGALERKQTTKVDGFVTLECAGVSSPMAWWSGSSAGIVEFAADVAQQAGVPLNVVDFPGTSSDSLSLKTNGIPTLSLLGVDPAHLQLLHGPDDRFDAVVPARVVETFTLLRALAADFDTHAQPLLWDYAKAKLRINDPASGRKPIRPAKLDLAAAALAGRSAERAARPTAPTEAAPAPAPEKSNREPTRDGSKP